MGWALSSEGGEELVVTVAVRVGSGPHGGDISPAVSSVPGAPRTCPVLWIVHSANDTSPVPRHQGYLFSGLWVERTELAIFTLSLSSLFLQGSVELKKESLVNRDP